jgi:hypothetical protein
VHSYFPNAMYTTTIFKIFMLDGDMWSVSRSDRHAPWETADGIRCVPDWVEREVKDILFYLLPLPRFEPQIVRYAA